MNTIISPPQSETDLLQRADDLAGKSIGELAQDYNFQVPDNLKRQKGWQGQFIEQCLGADSGNLSQPDFSHLNIELKTLPIDFSGKVQESTYVCVLNLMNQQLAKWQESPVFHKLQKVLWVPIARQKDSVVMDYKVATPFLWQPNETDFLTIRQDWENAIELVNLGQVDKLNARLGDILQVRPKAANSKALTQALDREGKIIETLPRGFYLRSQFTQQILSDNLLL